MLLKIIKIPRQKDNLPQWPRSGFVYTLIFANSGFQKKTGVYYPTVLVYTKKTIYLTIGG